MITFNKKEKNRGIGLIGILVLGFMLILALSYFNIDIKSTVESPTTQSNINYVKEGSQTIWQAYLKKPVSYIWNDIFIELFWKSFVKNINDAKSTDLKQIAPTSTLNLTP